MAGRCVGLALTVILLFLGGCLASEDPADGNGTEEPLDPAEETTEGASREATENASHRQDEEPTAEQASTPPPELAFTEPVALTDEHKAFEPSIEVGPEGTVYATAAPTERPAAGQQLSSLVWASTDGGDSFQQLSSPASVHERFPGLEGDVAVDGEGRLYFVDITLADTTLHRWSSDQAWELSRPLATTAPVDDRPWLEAHGDGVVHLLLNAEVGWRNGGDRLHNYWVYTSEDAGRTWTPGQQIDTGWCQPEAARDAETVLVVCQRWNEGDQRPPEASIHLSRDRAASFDEMHTLGFDATPAPQTPGAAIDEQGNLYAAVLDDESAPTGTDRVWKGDQPGRIRYTVSEDGGDAWTEHDVTPFEGRFGELHASAGTAGTLALTFYATQDLDPDEDTPWYAYGMVSRNATGPSPDWRIARLDDEPVANQSIPPRDFFQNDIGPDDALHVAFQRNVPYDMERDGPVVGISADVLYVRELGR